MTPGLRTGIFEERVPRHANRTWWALWRRNDGFGWHVRDDLQSIVRGPSLDLRGDGLGWHVRDDLHGIGLHVKRFARDMRWIFQLQL